MQDHTTPDPAPSSPPAEPAHAPAPIGDVLDLMVRVSHATMFRLTGPRPAEVGYVEVVAFALHDRCHGLLGATHLLLSQGFVHEAAIFGRPLFSASLTLAELATSDATQRGSLLVGMSLDHLARHEEYLRAREDQGHDVAADRERLAEARRGEEKFARELGFATKHRKPDDDLKGLAAKHGRSSEYSALLLTHQFVHGATGVVLDRVGRDGDKAVVGGLVARSKPWVRDFGLFASYSTLHSAAALHALLGSQRPPELNALMREVGMSTAAARRRTPS